MARHVLKREQFLAVSPAEAWAFFSNPRNLEAITPEDLRFRIETLESGEMHEGQIIVYRIRVALLVWVKWVTEILEVDEGREFVDVQKAGPYRYWHHRHTLEPEGEGVRMRDEVNYEVGWGFFGEVAHMLFVRRKLERIFDARERMLGARFGAAS